MCLKLSNDLKFINVQLKMVSTNQMVPTFFTSIGL